MYPYCIYFGLKVLPFRYIGPKVYTILVHGPSGPYALNSSLTLNLNHDKGLPCTLNPKPEPLNLNLDLPPIYPEYPLLGTIRALLEGPWGGSWNHDKG